MSLLAKIAGVLQNTFRIGLANAATLDASGLSAARTFTFPDEAGALQLSTTNVKRRTITCVFDGGGSAPTANTKAYVLCPFAGTIVGWRIVGDVTGSAVVDVWKVAYGSTLPAVGNTIAASAKPTLSSAKVNKDDTLTGWTTAITADDLIGFNLDSASTLTRLVVELVVLVTQ